MKKISELVDLRNQIQDIKLSESTSGFDDVLKNIYKRVKMLNAEFDVDSTELSQNIADASEKVSRITDEFYEYIENINNFIKENDAELRKNSEETSRNSINNADNNILKKIKHRETTHVEDTIQYFSERCKLYSSWKFPGLQIRPGVGTWTRNLVDLDPFYLADIDQQLLEPVKETFNENYVNRLRFHTISDVDKPIFANFPKNQFGLVLVTEFFNQKSLSTIDRYLKEIKELLQPGGACIFTFNDCDYIEGVRNAEHNYDCYTPGNEVADIAKSLGFEVIGTFSSYGTLFWMEIKLPGELSSLKGGQTLAKIQTTQ